MNCFLDFIRQIRKIRLVMHHKSSRGAVTLLQWSLLGHFSRWQSIKDHFVFGFGASGSISRGVTVIDVMVPLVTLSG